MIAGTTFLKFFIGAIGLTAFWGGFAAGLNYAASFLLVHMLHWTVATKQPAMTAPAMAEKLADVRSDDAVEGFVDEVAHLIRSQSAGIFGNLGAVIPVVLAVQGLALLAFGEPLVSVDDARHVLHANTLLGPTRAVRRLHRRAAAVRQFAGGGLGRELVRLAPARQRDRMEPAHRRAARCGRAPGAGAPTGAPTSRASARTSRSG